MRRRVITFTLVLLAVSAVAQESSNFGITFSGFVKNDVFFDSRQTVAAREGHFLLWPAAVSLDDAGIDINAKSNFNILAVQSRLKGAITGPDAFGAKTSGVIEADFFAQSNVNINLLRLRHAFVKLNWEHMELLAGQYWNPLFVTDCFPGTVSFNTGTPLQSFSRNPQVRATYSTGGGLRFTLAALSQRDYASVGEDGTGSSYLRNSAIPDMHLQAQYGMKDEESGNSFLLGGGFAYKVLVPRLESTVPAFPGVDRFSVNEKVGGLTAIGYATMVMNPVTIKLEARYGENISDVLAISGFAVREVVDPATGEQAYTPLTSMTMWGEIHTNGKLQAGLFGGFFRNLGTREPLDDAGNDVYGFGTTIHSLVRVSPRFIINSGSVRLAFEAEITSAAFGSNFDTDYMPATTTRATNVRGLAAVYYFF